MSSWPEGTAPVCPVCKINVVKDRNAKMCGQCRYRRPAAKADTLTDVAMLARLRKGDASIRELAEVVGVSQGVALDAMLAMRERGLNLWERDGIWSLEKAPVSGALSATGEYKSDSEGRYRFGFVSDTHLCSKYAREDVLEELYSRFRSEGVDRVFHAGNYLEGEASFNRFTIDVHGMQPQIDYLVKNYPTLDGTATYAVSGDDHEGWWCQREGVDIGRTVERAMQDAGRKDWVDLGYMEAFVPLTHAQTGASSMLHVVHPGGGSAYATSYTVQKLAEAYEGGEKPAVAVVGHYHKMELLNARNVWFIQAGCTKDADPWSRKKRLENAIGGGICELEQDADTGAIIGCGVRFLRYFNREAINGRWSHSGPVKLPRRTVA